ncbi:MAG TPA: BTAD domain-containing putative transcriptional regulator [Trebonia sp.]|nr:BTAD domain-containing putative transcriptional regulator [Trebonia sp.]
MRVCVLGPIEVTDGGRPVRLSGLGQRTVLAALAAEHGMVVPLTRLFEALWGGTPPPTARTKVQSHVSALRLALGRQVRDGDSPLQTIRPGYVLSADGASVDATEFADLMTRARQAQDATATARMLGEALALWRGPAFAGLDSPVMRAAGRLLDERRVLAVEEKAAADLSLDRFDLVVAELPGWVDSYPFRERLRALLMLALHQHGCRADALRLYRAGEQRMLHELGLQPSQRLRSLYHAILTDARRSPAGRMPESGGMLASRT